MNSARFLRRAAALVSAVSLVSTVSSWAQVTMSSPTLPPIGNDVHGLPTGYLTPAAVHAAFSGPGLSVILMDVIHQPFALISRTPGPDGSEIEEFQSTLDAMAIINGAPPIPFHAEGPVITRVNYAGGGPVGTFLTEMMSLDLFGAGVMIRESPTLPSQGVTQVQPVSGGFHIDSFFDVFTELSVDGGTTWLPNTEGSGATHVELQPVPEPGAVALLALGAFRLFGRRMRRQS
jgi:hypothetical protein